MTENKTFRKSILTLIVIGLMTNVFLSAIKLTFGVLGQSQALFSDGLNSFSDILISTVILVFMVIATKQPDNDHPYGHEKFEGLAYFILGLVFLGLAGYIAYEAVGSLITHFFGDDVMDAPLPVTIIVSGVALVTKLGLYLYYRNVGKNMKNPTIQADAKNHLIDVFATSFSLIGLSIAQLGLVYFDYLASLIIGLFILKLAFDILKEAISFLVDQAPSEEEIQRISDVIHQVTDVMGIDDLKVRKHMEKRYVDVEIAVNRNFSLEKGHQIAENVHDAVEMSFPDVIHCMVHVNPHKKSV